MVDNRIMRIRDRKENKILVVGKETKKRKNKWDEEFNRGD